jgi:hypothetical protein
MALRVSPVMGWAVVFHEAPMHDLFVRLKTLRYRLTL